HRAWRADRIRGDGLGASPRGFRGLRPSDGLSEIPRPVLEEGARPRWRPLGGAHGAGSSGRGALGQGWRDEMNALTPGGRINEALPLTPVRIAVLTVSDTRNEENDTSGHLLVERLTGAGHVLAGKAIVKDDVTQIRERVKSWTKSGEVDCVI